MRWGTSPVARVDGSALQELTHSFSLACRSGEPHALEKRGHMRSLANRLDEADWERSQFGHRAIFGSNYDNFGRRDWVLCVTNVRFGRWVEQEALPHSPKSASGTTTSALTRGSLRMLGSHLVDLCRRRGTAIARTSAAAGLALTLAGALAPTATATTPAAGGHAGHSLRSL